MSELKVYVKPIKTNMFGKMIVGQSYYLKSEADKVIAHQNYKRCLAMAEMCEAKYHAEDAKVNDGLSWEYISSEMKYWERWRWRWDALAEKFKEE